MPTTKRENLYFGLMMCMGMVLGMTTYNLIINDLIGTISWTGVVMQFVLGFVIAFLVDSFLVGPLAKKVAYSLPFDKSKSWKVIVILACFMVTGMVLLMSIYGLINAYFAERLVGESLIQSYFQTVGKNFIFALPLQLIVVGPLVRFLFVKYLKRNINA